MTLGSVLHAASNRSTPEPIDWIFALDRDNQDSIPFFDDLDLSHTFK